MKRTVAIVVTICIMSLPGISFSRSAGQTSPQQETNLSSPETTWIVFKNAIMQGNYDLALECCCPEKSKIIHRYKKLGAVKTQRIFKSIKSIEKVYQAEDVAKYKLHRDMKGENFITFISFAKIDDQWKINNY